jgi:hypothetical protein
MREAVKTLMQDEILEKLESGLLISGSSIVMTLAAMSRVPHNFHLMMLIQAESVR